MRVDIHPSSDPSNTRSFSFPMKVLCIPQLVSREARWCQHAVHHSKTFPLEFQPETDKYQRHRYADRTQQYNATKIHLTTCFLPVREEEVISKRAPENRSARMYSRSPWTKVGSICSIWKTAAAFLLPALHLRWQKAQRGILTRLPHVPRKFCMQRVCGNVFWGTDATVH